MKKHRFFITGISSFVGVSVAKYLLEKGHHVTGITRNKSSNSLKEISSHENLVLIEADLLNDFEMEKGIDLVFHAAAQAPNRNADVKDYVHNHVIATKKILDKSIEAKAKRFVFCSSILVFGKITDKLLTEDTSIVNPNLQGTCKYQGELILKEKSDEIPSLALRLPGIVGKGAHNIWLSKVLEKAQKNENIEITNPDAPFNNAIWTEDLARFLEHLAEKDWKGDRKSVV